MANRRRERPLVGAFNRINDLQVPKNRKNSIHAGWFVNAFIRKEKRKRKCSDPHTETSIEELIMVRDVHWYDLVGGLKSIVRWLPVIWWDRDWDWCHLAKLIEVKCTRIAKVIEVGYPENANVAAIQLRQVARLLARVRADNYREEIFGPITTCSAWLDDPDHPGYKDYHREHLKPDGSKVSNEEYLVWYKAARQAQKRELHSAMAIIASHLLEWWD